MGLDPDLRRGTVGVSHVPSAGAVIVFIFGGDLVDIFGDLVVGVWVGNDDSSPNPGLHGGGVPAQIWRNFMVSALGLAPPQAPVVVEENASDPEAIVGPEDPVGDMIDQAGPEVEGTLDGLGLQMKMGRDGSISITPGRDREQDAPREPREQRARGDEGGERE